jgi:alpha-ketoglutarate-dependent taurine dioxygenase
MPTDTTVAVLPATGHIGADVVGVDLTRPLDAATRDLVHDALLRWKVLFFREQPLTHDQQIAFARNWGDITPAHPVIGSREGYPPEVFRLDVTEIRTLTQRFRSRPSTIPRDPERGWHTDITFVANPALLSVLRAVEVPDHGGDTVWTNLVAAYAGLSAPIRGLIDGLRAVHRWNTEAGAGDAADAGPRPAAIHPVVRVHPETGERAIFVNPNFTSHILDVGGTESTEILELLYDQIRRPDYTVRLRWEPDTIAVWDNRATAHLGPVDLDGADVRRVVERVTVTGGVPVGPTGYRSEPLEGAATFG